MKILKTPWKSDFLSLVADSKKSIKITSPFIKTNICNEMLAHKKKGTTLEVITSFKLPNIHSGSLDLDGLESILNENGVVKNFSKLHSKIYLFDEQKVIITSGNLTNGGMVNNFEYGIFVSDKNLVKNVVDDFSKLSAHENAGRVKLEDIKSVREILTKIPQSDSLKIPSYEFEEASEIDDFIDIPEHVLTSSLSGWKLEVFKCANAIQKQIFQLKDINEFSEHLKKIYPDNNHITDKIRQQLQNLRDIGLLEFLGNGTYKKLWK
jgi:hypothetical protein